MTQTQGYLLTSFGQYLQDVRGFTVEIDNIVCPDCGAPCCLVSSFTWYGYVCTNDCQIDATDDDHMPYWACDVCEEGEVQNQMCDCWLPAPVDMLDDEIEINSEPSHAEEVLAMSYHI